MGRGGQADWAMAKILMSIWQSHLMNKCWKFQENSLIHVWVIAKRLKNCCNKWPPNTVNPLKFEYLPYKGAICYNNFSVNKQVLKCESSYLLEIFSICSSSDSAKLTSKFWPLLNHPTRHGPFRPKLWTALATVFVGIFFWKKFWLGSIPIPVAH